MKAERAHEILKAQFKSEHPNSPWDRYTQVWNCTAEDAILAACAEERRQALTEVVGMLERAQQPAAALGVLIMRDRP